MTSAKIRLYMGTHGYTGYTWVYRVYRGVQGMHGDKQSITIT